MGRLKEVQGKETIHCWQAWAEAGNLPPLFSELIQMHFEPHYGRSQARHFENCPQRDRVRASELTQVGINDLADGIVLLQAAG